MDFSWINGFSTELLRGLGITLKLLLLSGICGFALAVVVGLGRASRNPLIRAPMQFYISVFRGTPLLVQIYILYYGVGSLFAAYPPIRGSFLWPYLREGFWYVALALTLSVGAYVGEVLRGGLRAVPRGELEAARAYGMGYWLTLRRVWLPRALELVRPTLVGECVLLLKATALASTVAVTDLLGAANLVRAQTLKVYEPLLAVALIYIILAFAIEHLCARLGNPERNRAPQRQA
ncbi:MULTISPECIES: ABC transporter permease [Pseudomonas]|uniref:Nickel permease n=2 Tax=Pseudomonas TaxID=286 RepID=A0A9Q6IG89_9PSED|nr:MULTISPECIES: ABC transporter permease subunit [Pseudomonas]AXK53643.1 ABC transporter permease subunit [Pseudomonas protegens]MBS7561416.1 ABC transporter permease subunit [Pseudomonas sp. RC4D1]MBW8358087.1 ABC transporter permease subunit [Pseudomonas sp.]MCL9655152.1 ABC transporter permease subunit [Pseudomonas protegens]MCO7577735.1 ABC transporter permease subunit [Pseudomonas protegens]